MDALHALIGAVEDARDHPQDLPLEQAVARVHASAGALAAVLDAEVLSGVASEGSRDKLALVEGAVELAAALLAAQDKKASRAQKECQRQIDDAKRASYVAGRIIEFADALRGRKIAENNLHVTVVTRSELLNGSKARADVSYVNVLCLAILNAIRAGSNLDSAVRAAELIQLPAATINACLGLSLVLGGSTPEELEKGARLVASVDLKQALPVADCLFCDGFYVLNHLVKLGQAKPAARVARSLTASSQEEAAKIIRALLLGGSSREATATMRAMDPRWTPVLVEIITDFCLGNGLALPWFLQRESSLAEERILLAGGDTGRMAVAASRLASARFASARGLNRPSQVVYDTANPTLLRSTHPVALLVSEWWSADAPVAMATRKLEVLERVTKRAPVSLAAPPPLVDDEEEEEKDEAAEGEERDDALKREPRRSSPPKQPRVDALPPTSALKKLTIAKSETEKLKERLNKRLQR